jgi:hypothetical protein
MEFSIDFNYHAKLFDILNDRSLVIFNGQVFHKAVKGIVNKKLFMGFNNINFKDAITEFVADIKNLARLYIWLPRCEEVNKWEK